MVDNSVFALLILAAAILIWAHIGLTCSYLKRAHPSVWTALGKPSLRSSSIGSARVWRFIWVDHAQIDDLQLRAYVVSGQVLQVLALAVLFTLVVVNWQLGES
jgi:hypothetical protein